MTTMVIIAYIPKKVVFGLANLSRMHFASSFGLSRVKCRLNLRYWHIVSGSKATRKRARGLLTRWVTLGLNDLRSPPTLSDDSRDNSVPTDGMIDRSRSILGWIGRWAVAVSLSRSGYGLYLVTTPPCGVRRCTQCSPVFATCLPQTLNLSQAHFALARCVVGCVIFGWPGYR